MSRPIIIDRKGRQWLEETVVVKKEGDSYGITLAEAQPVFVQKTSKDGPADKAGIQAGDRIVKVNGSSIMNKTHLEVVDIIKNSTFVSLTVMRKISGEEGKHSSKSRSANATGNGFVPLAEQSKMSGDNLVFSPQNLKSLLKKQRAQYEKLTVQFARTQDDSLMAEIMECEVLIRDLEQQIAAQSPSINSHIRATQASIAALRGHKRSRSDSSKLAQLIRKEAEEAASKTPEPTRSSTGKPASAKTVAFSDVLEKYSPPPAKQTKFKIPLPFQSSSKSAAPPPPPVSQQSWSPPVPSRKEKDATMDVSPVSSDNEEDMNIVDTTSPFQSLQFLKGSPAHIAVFLHYMLDMKNKNPKKLCFYLVTQSYQDLVCRPFELKPRALDIFLTFLHEQSPLYIDLEVKHVGQRILDTLQNEELESKLRPVFMEARSMIQPSIEKDLSEFQQKRLMGLGWMFGDQKLSDTMAPEEVADTVYSTLVPHIKDIMKDVETADMPTRQKQTALAQCVATLVLDVGKPKTKTVDMTYLDKLTSITKCDVKKMKQKRKTESRQGHQFVPTIFAKPVMCDHCSKLLWSIGVQGLQCSNCDMTLHHAEECLSEVQPCHRDKKKKEKSYMSSTLPNLKKIASLDWDGPYDDQYMENEEGLLNGSASQPDVRISLKERSQSLTDTKAFPLITEARERGSVSVSRALSEKLPEKPHFSSRHKFGDGMVSSPSTMSFPASLPSIPTLSMDDVRRACPPPLSPLPDGSRSIFDMDVEADLQDRDLVVDELVPWAYTVDQEVVKRYNKYEKERQELIREFVYTERTHLKKLKVMLYIYKKPLIRQKIISYERVLHLFPNLEELILIHGILLTDLKARTAESPDEVRGISDLLLQRFDGEAGERLKKACSVFASNQARADMLFKNWKRSDERFKMFVRSAEAHPLCGRLKLTELTPIAWSRLTKYKLLVEGLIKQFVGQRTKLDNLTDEDELELSRLQMVLARVKNILEDVNREVKQTAKHYRLMEYQSKLDTSALEKSSSKLVSMFKGLDLTEGGRTLLHEGALTWKLQNKKIELHALLLSDIFVLMERDVSHDRYVLRTHTQTDIKGNKDELSPVIPLCETLWRDAATDRGGRTFFLASNSHLIRWAQMYELLAESASVKAVWEAEFKKASQACKDDVSNDSNRGDDDTVSLLSSDTTLSPLRSPTPSTSMMTYPEHLMRIDKTIVKLLEEKLSVIQGAQMKEVEDKPAKESCTERLESPDEFLESPVSLARAAIEQACVMVSAANAFLVPDLQIPTFVTAQSAIAEHAVNLQRYLTTLMRLLSGTDDYERRASTHTLVEEMRLGSPSSEPDLEAQSGKDDAEAIVSEEHKSVQGLSASPPSSQESTSEGEVEESEERAATLHNIMVFDFPADDTAKEEHTGEESLSSVASASLGAEGETTSPEGTQSDLEMPLPQLQPPPPASQPPQDSESSAHESLIAKLLSAGQSSTSLTSVISFEEDTSFVAPPPPPSFADYSTEVTSPTSVETPIEGESTRMSEQNEEESDESPPPLPTNPPPPMDLAETAETAESTDGCTKPGITVTLCNTELNETSEA